MANGSLREEPRHAFSDIRTPKDTFSGWPVRHHLAQPVVVDFDNDGDMDLFLGPPDGRYFEQLVDGNLREWSLEQSPVRNVMKLQTYVWEADGHVYTRNYTDITWRFVDCDGDGDFDLLRVRHFYKGAVQACKHDSTHTLRCDDNFSCLGTNLSRFKGIWEGIRHLDLGNVADGRLKFISTHWSRKTAVLWSAGFCIPVDPCHKKGWCLARQTRCSCIVGHELDDCSGCEPHFYSAQQKVGQMHTCKACPGDGQVCYGRGRCFDDVTAKAPSQEATAVLMALGNGSCICNENHFYGSDEEGRSTCMEGMCPAGTEESDGACRPCNAGSFSLAGGMCKICLPGTFSSRESSSCSICTAGSISKASGATECDSCPAGTYEVENVLCNQCPAGSISPRGSHFCTKCPAGSHSAVPGSPTCIPCPAGSFAGEASPTCSKCPPGWVSGAASSSCNQCDAGRFAKLSLACEACPGGRWSSAGSSECRSCLPGQFSLTGSGNCSDCLPGTVSKADAWQCDKCPAGTYEVNNELCRACPVGAISDGARRACSQCDAGRFAKMSLTCEACPGGTFAGKGSITCQACPLGHVSHPNSAACRSCDSFLIRTSPDATKQSCQVFAVDVAFALLCWIASAGFGFFVLTSCFGRIPIADLSAQGRRLVILTTMAHFLLKCPAVTFTKTGVPDLESSSHIWTVKPLSLSQLTLHGESTMPLDTSTGHLHLKFPHGFLSAGVWPCAFIWWCLLFGAACAATASQLTWPLTLVVLALGLSTGSLAFALRRRWGMKLLEPDRWTPIQNKHVPSSKYTVPR